MSRLPIDAARVVEFVDPRNVIPWCRIARDAWRRHRAEQRLLRWIKDGMP